MRQKFADAQRIRTIDFARSGIEGTGSLSPRARRTLRIYVILIKMGYSGCYAPMGAIADAVYRSSNGESKSIRTLQRANDELSSAGFITISQFRPDKWSRITFVSAAFSYWTGKRSENVQPLPTQSHNVVSRETMCDKSRHTTSCRASDRTRDISRVNSQNIDQRREEEPRAGARANNKPPRRKRNPVLFSVMTVLGKMSLYRADRKRARARAEVEVKAAGAGVELINPSGVDWQFWETRWGEMSIERKEATARAEIIPYLLSREKPVVPEPPRETLVTDRPSAEEIRAVRMQLASRVSLPQEIAPAPPEAAQNWEGSEEELAILLEAAARAARRVNGV